MKTDKLRLIALIQLGRNKTYFLNSIDLLSAWLKNRDYDEDPLAMLNQIFRILSLILCYW